jgi:YVTN family beta-propeller protein
VDHGWRPGPDRDCPDSVEVVIWSAGTADTRRTARASHLAFGFVVLAPLLVACSDARASSVSSSGPAFPDLRASFANEGRTLGYVSNGAADSVSVLDLDGMMELGRVSVGRDPVGLDGPTVLAFDHDHDILYLAFSCPVSANEGPHAAHESLPHVGYVEALARSDLRPLGELFAQPSTADIQLSADANLLLVSHYDVDLAAQLGDDIDLRRAPLLLVGSPFGIETGAAMVRTLTVCAAPYGIAYGKDSSRAYVACAGEDSLTAVDTVNAAVIARVPVGSAGGGVSKPYALVADPAGEHVLVSNKVSRSVVLFSTSDTPEPVWTTAFDASLPGIPGGVPYFAAWISDSDLFVPLQSPDGAVLLDAATGAVKLAVTYALDQCEAPRDARVTPDGRLFVVCEGDHFDDGAVVEVDTATLEIKARVSVGVGPDHLLAVPP